MGVPSNILIQGSSRLGGPLTQNSLSHGESTQAFSMGYSQFGEKKSFLGGLENMAGLEPQTASLSLATAQPSSILTQGYNYKFDVLKLYED